MCDHMETINYLDKYTIKGETSMKHLCAFAVGMMILSQLFITNSISIAAEKTPIIIKYAHTLPDNQSIGEQAKLFAKYVNEKSEGRIVVEIYPAAQLFTARDVFPAVRKGGVEMASVVAGTMQGSIPLMEVFDLPFLFRNYEHVKSAWAGDLGSILKGELEQQGIKFLAEGYHSFIDVCNSKKDIKSPSDIKGLKFRTIGPMTADIVRAMGGAPVVMGGDEAYLAMARKLVDGSFQGVNSMYYRKIFEVQKHATILNMNYTGVPMMMNLNFWDRLPKDIQQIIQEGATKSEDFVLSYTQKEEKDAVDNLTKKGMALYYLKTEELNEFKKIAAPIKNTWTKKHGTMGERIVADAEKIK